MKDNWLYLILFIYFILKIIGKEMGKRPIARVIGQKRPAEPETPGAGTATASGSPQDVEDPPLVIPAESLETRPEAAPREEMMWVKFAYIS